jgi:hypothetical protein
MPNNVTRTSRLQETRDYEQFQYLNNNREVNRGHVEALKKAFEEYGNLTKVQPVLVNERMQIIDGQHRFEACKELGEPIFYNIVPGLSITEARKMNILHRGWTTDDYARSYAVGGNPNYQKYLDLKEEYGFTHSVMIDYCNNASIRTGMFADFREGLFVLADEASVRERLDMLAAAGDILGHRIAGERVFARALLKVSQVEGFKLPRMLKQLKARKDHLRQYTNLQDAMRQLEEVYNYGYHEGNRFRLY